jgi:hypothetical protein
LSKSELSERFDAIKAYYRGVSRFLVTQSDEWGIDPYAWTESGSGIDLSPIEWALWDDIRMMNMVMYPQYPVGRYFVDFANPAAKVAIECDGKRWHTDRERDASRQAEIEAMGWVVYRITGRDCFSDSVEGFDEDDRPTFEYSAARKFVMEICERHPVQRLARESSPRSFDEIFAHCLAQRRSAA